MVQFEQLAEAERIIEQIGGCNGLCKSEFRQVTITWMWMQSISEKKDNL